MRRAVLVCLCLAPTLVGADEVLLKGGGKVAGVIVERTASSIVVEVGPGLVTLPLSRVLSIQEGPTALASYRERASGLSPSDLGGWLALSPRLVRAPRRPKPSRPKRVTEGGAWATEARDPPPCRMGALSQSPASPSATTPSGRTLSGLRSPRASATPSRTGLRSRARPRPRGPCRSPDLDARRPDRSARLTFA